MPRRRVAAKREILPDPKFGSIVLAKFINVLMVDGKKSIAEKVVYGALEKLVSSSAVRNISQEDEENQVDVTDPVAVFTHIIEQVKPKVEVRSRRVGGATYQVPVEVRQSRGAALAMRWIVDASRQRNEQGMMLRLSHELQDVLQEKGSAIKKKIDSHRMAKANQAFAHFRWG